jgi:hypothetical protein
MLATKKTPVPDYTINDVAQVIGIGARSIRNALSRYRRHRFTEREYEAGITTIPLPYRTGNELRWTSEALCIWRAARAKFVLLPMVEQRKLFAKACARCTRTASAHASLDESVAATTVGSMPA